MASTSEQLLKGQEEQSINQTVYKTKKIYFSGRNTRIILQNENGPCPLIAICNVLLLRGRFNLGVDQTHVSEEELLTFVADSLFNSLDQDENGVKTVADAIDWMPYLKTGMFVDVKFQRIDDFDFTRENEVFGLLDIPLVHGWLIDPQDTETAKAIGSKSYNTLMSELVAHQIIRSQGSEAVSVKKSEEDNVEVEHFEKEDIDPTSANSYGVFSELITNVAESSKKMKEIIAESSSLTAANLDGVISEPASNVAESSERMKETIAELSSSTTANSDSVISEPTLNVVESSIKMKEEIAESSSSASTSNVNEGELINKFLENNPTQLTAYGLFCLQTGLEEQKLCVFFRNNHFNTMFRYIGELYILVTDEGYMDRPGVVWEKLTEVNGNTIFANNYFMDFTLGNHEIEEIPESDSESVKKKDAATLMKGFEDYLEELEGSSSFNPNMQAALELLGIDENELLLGPEVEEIPKSEEKRVKYYFENLIKTQGSLNLSPNAKEALKLLGLDEKDILPYQREVENHGLKPEAGNPDPEPKLERDYSNSRRERMSSKKVKRIIKEKCYLM